MFVQCLNPKCNKQAIVSKRYSANPRIHQSRPTFGMRILYVTYKHNGDPSVLITWLYSENTAGDVRCQQTTKLWFAGYSSL